MLKNEFPAPKSLKPTSPFSLRLSHEERQELEKLAGGRPLGEYIKDVLFVEKRRPKRLTGQQILDKELFAKGLLVLGQSRLAPNVNQLAKASNSGSLQINDETIAKLHKAMNTIADLRHFFIQGTGTKSDSSSGIENHDP